MPQTSDFHPGADASRQPFGDTPVPIDMGGLLDRCLAVCECWPGAGSCLIVPRVDASLQGPRIGPLREVAFVLLQLMRLAVGLAPTEPIDLWLGVPDGQQRWVRCRLQLRHAQALLAPCTGSALPEDTLALDLAVLAQLLQPLGGRLGLARLTVETQQLWVDLPLAPAPPPSAPAAARTAAGDRPLRVLLVEDNPVNAELTTLMLHGDDMAVTVAGSGSEALSLVMMQRFDVVLMDMFLPDTDGIVVARKIGRLLGPDAPPVVALTANADPADRQMCLEAGMVDFLLKPAPVATLLAVVRHWGQWCRQHVRGGSDLPDPGLGQR